MRFSRCPLLLVPALSIHYCVHTRLELVIIITPLRQDGKL